MKKKKVKETIEKCYCWLGRRNKERKSVTDRSSTTKTAALRKEGKYRELYVTHNFVPIALETLVPIGSTALTF